MVGSLWLVSHSYSVGSARIWCSHLPRRVYRQQLAFSPIAANIANLAAVPSVIYGLLGLSIYIRILGLGHTHQGASLIAGACTLSLLIMPIIVVSSREALRTVPIELREAGSGLGARMANHSTSRLAFGPSWNADRLDSGFVESHRGSGTVVGAGCRDFHQFSPDGLDAPYSALPIQIFDWLRRPNDAFIEQAAAIIVLGTVLTINGVAVWIRYRLQAMYGDKTHFQQCPIRILDLAAG